jgi:periplasmic protein TonB
VKPNADNARSALETARRAVVGRYALAALGGFVVNLIVFGLLQALVAPRVSETMEKRVRPAFEFLRLRRDETAQTKTRRLPDRKRAKPSVASAPLAIAKSAAPSKQGIDVAPGGLDAGFALAGRPYLGAPGGDPGGEGDGDGVGDASGAGSDTDAVALVRVNPLYPPRAQARGIQGWVLVEFTVTRQGTTKDIVVIDADPKGYFERSATVAVEKYRYKPRIENGVPVDRPGVRLVISFAIEG